MPIAPEALMALAGGLLQQSGPSRMPQSFGQRLGGAMAPMLQMQQYAQEQARQGRLDQMKMAELAMTMQDRRQQQAAQQREQQAAQAAQAARQQYIGGLPPEQQALAAAYPEKFGAQATQAAFPAAPAAETLKQVVDPETGQTVWAPASKAIGQRAPEKGPQVQIIQPKLEAGYIPRDPRDLSKGVIPQPGGSKDPNNPKNWTGEQRKAAGFAARLNSNSAALTQLEQQGYSPGTPGQAISKFVGRPFMGEQAKSYQDHKEDWIRAWLRKESGATITAEENAQAQIYFPQIGDTAEDIARKAQIRQQVESGIIAEAGAAYQAPAQQAVGQQAAQQLSPADLGSLSIEQLQQLQGMLGGANNP